MKEKSPSYPILTQLSDFEECGIVYNYLINDPDASDYEVAKQAKLRSSRVASLRIYMEYEIGLTAPWWAKTQYSHTR